MNKKIYSINKIRMSIRTKMFWAIYALILLLTLIVDSLVFFTYKYDIETQITEYGNQASEESANNISRTILSKEENLTYKLQQVKLFEGEHSKIYLENSTEIKELVALVKNAGFHVTSCYIQRKDMTEEFWSDGSINISEFRESKINEYLKKEAESFSLNRGTVVWRRMEDEPESVYIIKNVVDSDTLEKKGILSIQIKNDFFKTLQNSEKILTVLYDENGDLLYYSEQLEGSIDEILNDNTNKFLVTHADISKKNWSMTGLISKQQVLNTLYHLIMLLGIIELIFFIVSFGIAKYVSGNMTANIASLIDRMKQIEHGEEAQMIQAKSADETTYLVEAFNDMNRRLQETIELLAVNRTQKERAEYNALITQLNPHFLYNSLASISAMAKLNHQTDIVEAVDNLAKLLRICLTGNDSEITLNKEIEYIEQYLSLEKLITGGQIDWDINCEEELYSYCVPKLILQPLVENCIVHGFDKFIEEAVIVIIVRIEEEQLWIEVSDNGVGMPQEYADEILISEEVRKDINDRRHIGIKSIQQRITYLYGENYGLAIQSKEGAGTTVQLKLPLKKG